MSDKTFNMPTEDQADTPLILANRGRLLDLDSSYSLSLSPDSDGCNCNVRNRGDSTSPDISTVCKGGPMISPYNTLPEGKLFTNLDNTFIATPDNGSMNFWNDVSLLSNQDSGEKKYHTFYKSASEGSSSAVMSPDSVEMDSCRTSHRGSLDNDFSFSSGEMVVRTNSFCLEEQSHLVLSSLEESPAPSATNHVESKLLLIPVCEKDATYENQSGHPCLGMTFIVGDKLELPSEDDLAMSNSLLALPSEKEGLFSTFLCENSPVDSANEAQLFCPEAELLNDSKTLAAPEQGIAFVSTLCAVQDIHTSTPVQNLGSQMPSLPSFAVSPCTENSGSPALRPVLKKKSSVTPKRFERGPPASGSKDIKMEINKFPKSDFSSIKCKVITRAVASASLNKPPQMNSKNADALKVGSVRPSPTRINNGSASVSAKIISDSRRRQNTGASHMMTSQTDQSLKSSPVSEGIQKKSRALVPAPLNTDASKQAPAVHCSPAGPDTEQAVSSQVDAPSAGVGNHTFCLPEKSPQRSSQTNHKQTPKKDVTSKLKKVISSSALGQNKPTSATRPRCSSESSTVLSRLLKIQPQRFSSSFTFTKTDNHQKQTKPGNQESASQRNTSGPKGATETFSPKVKKVSSVFSQVESSTSTSASCDESKARFRGQPFPSQTGRPLFSKAPAASPMMASHLKQKLGTSGRESSRTTTAVGTPQPKQKNTSNRKGQASGETSRGLTSTATTKLNSCQHPQTPSRPPLMGPPSTPLSRLQPTPKTFGSTRSRKEAHSEPSDGARTTQVSGRRPTPFKAVVLKARLTTTPAKTTGPVLNTACKPAPTSKGPPNGLTSPQKGTATSRLLRLSAPVDKNKPRASSRPQPQPERFTSKPHQAPGPRDVGPTGVTEGQKKDQRIQQLQAQLVLSNSRFEAFAVVLQQTLAQRDEAVRQSRGLSQELVDLRGQLVNSATESERLEKEKEELRAALQDAVEKVREQHQRDLLELEQRLRASYQDEWSAAHQTHRDEADKCRALMQQQMGELKASHEAMKQDLEKSHTEQLQSVKQQYEHSLEELTQIHAQELQSLSKTLKDAEMVLSEKIRELTQENNALMEKLTEEENNRKEPSQKDSHTVYLEQELESLKVVLDIKNKQLHQQEKKLMEIDKLVEKNVKLDESLRKVQQENEDLKARMERHATLSRQLSTEQALLLENLQKESKMNKRLSMENEELLWKLHNGDPSSPGKASPTSGSPSHFGLQSPRSPALFSSPPVSPR